MSALVSYNDKTGDDVNVSDADDAVLLFLVLPWMLLLMLLILLVLIGMKMMIIMYMRRD